MTLNNKITAFGTQVNIAECKIVAPQADVLSWHCDDLQFYLQIKDVATYQVIPAQNIINIEKASTLQDEYLINTWLYGTVFAYLLQHRGYLVLHGSAVLVNGRAVVFSGDSGAGKSTLAASMVHHGYQLITDDVVAIRAGENGQLLIEPGPSRVKLWSDALTQVGKSSNGLQKVINKEDKYELPISKSHPDAVPLAQFYELNPAEECGKIEMTQQQANDKINTLIKNTYRYQMLKPMGKIAQHFHQIVSLAKQIEVYKIVRPSNQYLLNELTNILIANFK